MPKQFQQYFELWSKQGKRLLTAVLAKARALRAAPARPPNIPALVASLKRLGVSFLLTTVACCLLIVVIYFATFHGECSIRIIPGPGETVYYRLYQREQFFFNLSISRKSWWELAENSADFDPTGYNGGQRIRWRGFGYLWKWEESFDIVY